MEREREGGHWRGDRRRRPELERGNHGFSRDREECAHKYRQAVCGKCWNQHMWAGQYAGRRICCWLWPLSTSQAFNADNRSASLGFGGNASRSRSVSSAKFMGISSQIGGFIANQGKIIVPHRQLYWPLGVIRLPADGVSEWMESFMCASTSKPGRSATRTRVSEADSVCLREEYVLKVVWCSNVGGLPYLTLCHVPHLTSTRAGWLR